MRYVEQKSSPYVQKPVNAPLQWHVWFAYGAYIVLTVTLFMADFSRSIGGLKPGELLLVLFVGILALHRVLNRDFSFVVTPIDAGFLALIIAGTWIPLVVTAARGIYITSDIVHSLVGPILYYFWYRAFLEALPLATQVLQITKVALITITALSFIGILQFIHFPKVESLISTYYPSHNVSLSVFLHRSTSLVGGWEVLAALTVYALIMINQLLTTPSDQAPSDNQQTNSAWNMALVVMGVINIVALITTQSIAGFIGIVVGVGMAWLLNRRLARPTIIIMASGLVALLIASPFLLRKVTGTTAGGLTTWQERLLHWRLILSLFTHASTIIFGVQPGFTYPVSTFNSTESFILLLLYRGGLIYLCAFIIFIVILFRYLINARRQATGLAHQLITIVLIIFAVNCVLDVIDAHFIDAGEWQILMTMLVVAVSSSQLSARMAINRTGSVVQDLPTVKRSAVMPQPSVTMSKASFNVARVGVALVVVGLALSAGAAWYHNRHIPKPVTALSVSVLGQGSPSDLENNNQVGSLGWQLSPGVDTTFLQGYAGSVSVQAGAVLPLYISAKTSATYNLDVYRIGWYRGEGGRLFFSAHDLQATNQGRWTTQNGLQCDLCQTDPKTHRVEANWTKSYDLMTGVDWVSGVYLVKLSALGSGVHAESYIPFVVRDDNSHSLMLVNLPFNTYQADNIWGGYNLNGTSVDTLYTGIESANRATQVSFDRPFAASAGAGDLLNWDIHTIRWLERSGLDVSYTTNSDVAEQPQSLTQHKMFITLGHDAYWTRSMRDGITQARDQGTSLLFLGAGAGYWQARLAPDSAGNVDRTLVCYQVHSGATDPTMQLKQDPLFHQQPSLVTAPWRDQALNKPENALIGLMQGGYVAPASAQPDWKVTTYAPLSPIEAGLHPGQVIKGVTPGYIVDIVNNNGFTPRYLSTFGGALVTSVDSQPLQSQTAYYVMGHALVFDAGSIWWAWGLDEATIPGASQQNGVHGNQSLVNITMNVIRTALPNDILPPNSFSGY